MANNFVKAISDLLFPVRCPYCDTVIHRNNYACEQCKANFPIKTIRKYAVGGYPCCSPFPYECKFSAGVKRFKFSGRGAMARQLCVPVVGAVKEIYSAQSFDVVTCVPMHKSDKKRRGYNQAELLAGQCAMLLGIEYADLLVKHKHNRPQHELKARDREANVRGVFRATDKSLIEGKRILLIDDIITTGNTLGECARILMKNGSKSVSCAVICTVI